MNALDLAALFAPPDDPSLLTVGRYDPLLVALSVAVAVFASWMALQVAGLAALASSRALRATALLTGSLALGAGVWAMHFIGMLAFDLCTPVSYLPGITVWSMLPSIAAAAVVLWLIARQRIDRWQLVCGGALMGAGIGAMHYAGMAAMRSSLAQRYDPFMFALSILVAVVLAIVALWIRFGMRNLGARIGRQSRLLVSAIVMGCAIAGMHYIGMAAARFVGKVSPTAGGTTNTSFLALAVCLIAVAFTVFVLAANGLLRYRDLFRQLSEKESRLRALLATAGDGVIMVDARGIVRDFNASAERIFGWPAAEIVGGSVDVLLDAPERARYVRFLRTRTPTGRRGIAGPGREVHGLRRDGARIPIRLALGHANLGHEPMFLAFVTDISERKAMEHALRASEQQLRSLVGNIPGISYRCLAAPDAAMLFVSDAVERLTGHPAGEFREPAPVWRLIDLVHPDDRDRYAQEIAAAVAEDRPFLIEHRMLHRDGTTRWMWSNGSPVRDEDGWVQWLDGVILDITERKRAELEVQKFRAIIASSGDAIISQTLDGVIASWNQGAERVFGHPADEVIGSPMSILAPSDRPDEEPGILARIADGGHVEHFEIVRRRRDGRLIDVSATASPIHDAGERVVGISMIARDISERRRMEIELRDAKERAEQAAAARAAFLANMSHEIRTPMNLILGFTDVLLQGRLQAEQRRHLLTVRSAAGSLLRLLNEVLDTAKLDKGAMELELADFDLLGLVDELSSTMDASARSKGLVLGIRYDATLPRRFHGDELRIRQVLTNLLGNAIKFTESGSVTLGVDAMDGQVHVAVRDTGIGIPEHRLAAIFDPFTQADASTTRRFGGTGLGTTICKQLVELMGGRIWVESTPGRGSVFHVVVPLAVAHDLTPQTPASRSTTVLPALHILVADDVPQNLEMLALLLDGHGHTLVTAADGVEVVRRAMEDRYDAILMDVQMPGMDGLEATRRIRRVEAERGTARVPVIALSASVLSADRRAAQEAGMDGFASKPVDIDALLQEIARVLDRSGDGRTATPPTATAGPRLLDSARGLQRWVGRRDAYHHALGAFSEIYRDSIVTLRGLVATRDGDAARMLTHKIKGSAGNLSLDVLAAAFGRLDEAATAGDWDALSDLLPRATADLEATLDAIREALVADAPGVPTTIPGTVEQIRSLGAALMAALDRGAIDVAALEQLTGALPDDCAPDRLRLVRQAFDEFDFPVARSRIAELLAGLPESATEARA